MNKTLQQYLDETNKFHKVIMGGSIMIDPVEIKKMLEQISKNIKTIQTVSHRMASIYTMSKRKISTVSAFIEKEIRDAASDTFPSPLDWQKLTNPLHMRMVAPNVSIKANTIDSLNQLPDAPMYWVKDVQQFAISINGTILRGNIGNIYEKNDINKKNVRECKKYDKCLSRDTPCNYFHDPIKLKNTSYRNFMNNSWLYTDAPRSSKNYNMRHFGNRNTLSNDIHLLKFDRTYKHEIRTRFFQTMHDLLIILSIGHYSL